MRADNEWSATTCFFAYLVYFNTHTRFFFFFLFLFLSSPLDQSRLLRRLSHSPGYFFKFLEWSTCLFINYSSTNLLEDWVEGFTVSIFLKVNENTTNYKARYLVKLIFTQFKNGKRNERSPIFYGKSPKNKCQQQHCPISTGRLWCLCQISASQPYWNKRPIRSKNFQSSPSITFSKSLMMN